MMLNVHLECNRKCQQVTGEELMKVYTHLNNAKI